MNTHSADQDTPGVPNSGLLQELEEFWSQNAQMKEMLNANNYTKEEINQNNAMVSSLFEKVYLYTKEIGGKLMAIGKVNHENETRFEAIQADYMELDVSIRKKLEQLKVEKVSILEATDMKKLEEQKRLAEVNSKIDELGAAWENFMQEQNSKRNDGEGLNVETEDLLRKLQETELEKKNEIDAMESNISDIYETCHETSKEMDDLKPRIRDTENCLQLLRIGCMENEAKKKEVPDRQRSLEKENLELSSQCLHYETLIHKSKEDVALVQEKISTELRGKVELVKITEEKLLEMNNKILCVQNETEQFKLKTEELEAKTSTLKLLLSQQETEINQRTSAIEYFKEQTVKIETEINFVQRAVTEREKVLTEKQTYFNEMKNNHNSELNEIDNKTKTMEEEFQLETNEMQKEVDEIDEENKNLQVKVAELEKKLEESKLEELKQSLTIREMKENLDKLTLYCKQCETDFKSYNNTKLQQKAVNRKAAPVKRPSQFFQRKRPVTFDSDSSSVDGEKLNYFEFQSRKKAWTTKKRKL